MARAHLSRPLADRWISLLRPAVEFPYSTEPVEPEHVALRVAGDPLLPAEMDWPVLDGYGPLMFMADMDCAMVAAAGGVELLPTEGHLLFFFAGHPDRFPEGWDTDASGRRMVWEQGRVLYIPPGRQREPRSWPGEVDEDDWLEPTEPYACRAVPIGTPPGLDSELLEHNYGAAVKAELDAAWETARLGGTLGSSSAPLEFELWGEFEQAVNHDWTFCYTGGYAHSCQGPVELAVAYHALGTRKETSIEARIEEAAHWRLLFQTAWDPGDMVLYWFIRAEDLAVGRFDRICFDVQR